MSEKNPQYNLQLKLSDLKRLKNNKKLLQSEIDNVCVEIKQLRPFSFKRFLCFDAHTLR